MSLEGAWTCEGEYGNLRGSQSWLSLQRKLLLVDQAFTDSDQKKTTTKQESSHTSYRFSENRDLPSAGLAFDQILSPTSRTEKPGEELVFEEPDPDVTHAGSSVCLFPFVFPFAQLLFWVWANGGGLRFQLSAIPRSDS